MKYLLLCICLASAFICWKVFNISTKSRTIGIQPLGQVDRQLLQTVSGTLYRTYQCRTVILPAKELPKHAFTNIKSPRYRAEKLIAWLWKNKPDSVDYIIGITAMDISTTKRDAFGRIKEPEWKCEDWGVMGLGYCPGKSCVISTFRLKTTNKKLFAERVQKVSVHEIGHNLWLKHCPENSCVMSSANESIKNIDKEKLALCENCSKKIDN